MNDTGDEPFRDELFDELEKAGTTPSMTIVGTIDKALILLIIVLVVAALTWTYIPDFIPVMLGAVVGAFVVGFVTSFRTSLSPYTAPLFAVLEGVFLGGFSRWMETLYPGIVPEAIALTFCVFFLLLLAFRARLICATERLRSVILGSMGAIILFYLGGMVLAALGISFGLTGLWGWIGVIPLPAYRPGSDQCISAVGMNRPPSASVCPRALHRNMPGPRSAVSPRCDSLRIQRSHQRSTRSLSTR